MIPSRFMAKVEFPDGLDGCWQWSASASTNGYGQFWDPEVRKVRRAHRVTWEAAYGPVPDGFCLDHLCRNRRCVNPDHLEPVTNQENVIRGFRAREVAS